MSEITLNTKTLKTYIDKLKSYETYYTNKKSSFSTTGFGSGGNLASYLLKIQTIYSNIGSNIKETTKFLEDYINDAENLENRLIGDSGFIKETRVNNIVSRYRNSLKKYDIDSEDLFKIIKVDSKGNSFNAIGGTVNKKTTAEKKEKKSQAAINFLSFGEGILNALETLGDGVLMLGVGACNLLELCGIEKAGEQADKLADIVKEDESKRIYQDAIKENDLDKYANPESIGAKVASGAGTIILDALLIIGTGGLAGAAFGTGTAAATTATVVGRGALGFAEAMGQESEYALQNGASRNQAFGVGLTAGTIGAITNAASGKMDDLAKVKGIGVGKIIKYSFGSGMIGVGETVVNEVVQTTTYKNDGELSINDYIENLKRSAPQMAISFGSNFAGTFAGGMFEYKKNQKAQKTFNLDDTLEMPTIDLEKNLFEKIETFDKRLIGSIGNETEFQKLIDELKEYTDDSFTDKNTFQSTRWFKKNIVYSLKEENMLSKLSDYEFNLLIEDNVLFYELLDTSRMEDFVIHNISKMPETINKLLSKAPSINSLNDLFNKESINQYFNSISDDEFLNIITRFATDECEPLFINCKNITDRFLKMDITSQFKYINQERIINALNTNQENAATFLKSLIEKYELSEMYNDLDFSKKLYNSIPYNHLISDYKTKIYERISQLKKQTQDLLLKNSKVPINLNDYENYVDISYIKDGVEITKTSRWFSKTDLLSNVPELTPDCVITSIKNNEVKNTLLLNNLNKGLNKIVLEIDGKPTTLVKKLTFESLDLNIFIDTDGINQVKILSIDSLPSYNFNANPNKIYRITYNSQGQNGVNFVLTDKNGVGDIDKLMTSYNLYDISDVVVEETNQKELKSLIDISNKYKESVNIFNTTKYGGDQSDVTSLVVNKLSKVDMNDIDTKKADLLIDIVKKHYPEATSTDIKNIVEKYSNSGCWYMAVSNDFATFMGSQTDANNKFLQKFGYDLYFEQDDKKYYNLESLALDFFLNVNGNQPISELLKHETLGVSISKASPYLEKFFNKHNIVVNYNYSLDDNIVSVLNNNQYFPIVSASGFDLEVLAKSDIPKNSLDGALNNSTFDGTIYKNIGGHAMALTGIDEDGNLIVSSWGEKCKFIKPISENMGRVALEFVKFSLGGE